MQPRERKIIPTIWNKSLLANQCSSRMMEETSGVVLEDEIISLDHRLFITSIIGRSFFDTCHHIDLWWEDRRKGRLTKHGFNTPGCQSSISHFILGKMAAERK
mmetsp:Transcript_10495/g.16824  ORF Transcript_10495/g.16824 Transcript_10495/m.16824 type:complete len:103 (-) Transcript_10495:43-351(-)